MSKAGNGSADSSGPDKGAYFCIHCGESYEQAVRLCNRCQVKSVVDLEHLDKDVLLQSLATKPSTLSRDLRGALLFFAVSATFILVALWIMRHP